MTSFAAEALVTLALHEQSGPQIVEEGAVVPLAQLCSTSTDNAMLSYASGALANLALDEGSRAQMVADGAVAPLVKICSKSQDKRVLGYAALALARLAMSEGSSLADVSGGSALYGLTRAQQTLGRDMPPYLIQVSCCAPLLSLRLTFADTDNAFFLIVPFSFVFSAAGRRDCCFDASTFVLVITF